LNPESTNFFFTKHYVIFVMIFYGIREKILIGQRYLCGDFF
jgi:hypothetical protein